MAPGKFYRTVTVLFIILYACTGPETSFSKSTVIADDHFNGTVSVKESKQKGVYVLSICNTLTGNNKKIFLKHKVFDLQIGDINRDGKTDICLGVIKATPFDPVLKKRLFIYQIDRDHIRPLWLASRLYRPLENFYLPEDQPNLVRTIEHLSPDLFCINEYTWGSFGLVYLKTKADSLSREKAYALLNSPTKLKES